MTTAGVMSVILAAASVLCVAQTSRDSPAPGTAQTGALLAGTIISDDAAARPVRQATITISDGVPEHTRTTFSDDLGRFVVADLPSGGYTLSVSKAGWVTCYYGSAHPERPALGGAPLTLRNGEQLTNVTLRLLHGSAVSGVVTDTAGRPMIGVRVQLLRTRIENGQRAVTGSDAATTSATDDRGVYRLYGVPPGEYVVVALPRATRDQDIRQLTPEELQSARRAVGAPSDVFGGENVRSLDATRSPQPQERTVGYAPTYYPGTADISSASLVALGANDERLETNVVMTLVQTVRIQGVLTTPGGRPASAGQVEVVPANTSGVTATALVADVAADGTFAFSGIVPGRYTLIAHGFEPSTPVMADRANVSRRGGSGVVAVPPASATAQPLWAMDTLTVGDHGARDLALHLQPGATIAGRLVCRSDSLASPSSFSDVRVALRPVGQPSGGRSAIVGEIGADGRLTFADVAPGRYRVDVTPPDGTGAASAKTLQGWRARSAEIDGRDALDVPFDVALGTPAPELVVTLTDRLAELSGTITDAGGHPVTAYRLVVFPADQNLWGSTGRRLKILVPTDPNGAFRAVDLPAGEYFLAAVIDIDPEDLTAPSFLAELASHAIRVTLRDGEHKVQDVRLGGG